MKSLLVIGSARSGSAVSKLLCKKGFKVYLTDAKKVTNKQELEKLGIAVYDGGHPEVLKEINYAFIVKNPGIPYTVPFVDYFVKQGKKIYTEIEIASWYAKKFQYGAITGTNGKTTTVSILYALLQKHENSYIAGNIGIPLSEVVLEHEVENANIALELSNFQLLGIETFKPKVSVVTNLAPDHLDYMKDIDAYYKSKMRIYKNGDKADYFLRNTDDKEVMKYAKNIPCTIIDYSLEKKADLYLKGSLVYYKNTYLFDIKTLKLVGKHNILNSMVAACMAYLLGVTIAEIQEGLCEFTSVEHRLEYVGERNGIRFFNDSKATNAEAVVPALESFEKNIILLAGGYDKKLSFDVLKPYNDRVKYCFSFGETRKVFKNIFCPVEELDTMKEAFNKAISLAKPGDVIVLSPACASYDQFASFEERGNIFKAYVHSYLNEGGFHD